jgi:uncharacterized protein YutE (UPF0331/DUF86 family)
MNPVKVDVIERKKTTILAELKILAEIQRRFQAGQRDAILEHALLHAMQNCIAAVIDIAQHIVAEKQPSPPESYSEAIATLGALGVLEQPFADEFARVAKLRNVLVHLYDNVDHNFLFSLVPNLVRDSKKFVKQVSDYSW